MAYTADLLYMPAIHQGYMDYLNRRSGGVGILDERLVHEVPRMDRDIRALAAKTVAQMVKVHYPQRIVAAITPDNIGFYRGTDAQIFMPDEDVSHQIAETHLAGMPVTFEKTFLRWDRPASLAQAEVSPDRIISTEEHDQMLMALAKEEAQNSPDWWRQVGAIITKDGEIVLQGHNHPYPTEHGTLETFGDPRSNFDAGERIDLQRNIHAEAGLIARAAKNGISLEGSEICVSTFPCPNCAKLVAESGITRVYYSEGYSLLDAEDIFKAKGVEVVLVQADDKPGVETQNTPDTSGKP